MTQVAVIEDNARYRTSLEALLTHSAGVGLAASFETASAAVDSVAEQLDEQGFVSWDVALMDVEMPGMNGIEATRRLKALLPDLKVIVVTVFEDPKVILEAICAGADGYLLKRSSTAVILDHIRLVRAGGAPLTPVVARTVLDLLRDGTAASTAREPAGDRGRSGLTQREEEVLSGLVRGLAYKQIAEELGISIDTVRTHIKAIYRKLQVHSVGEAVSRALRDGIA